eukprot:tig00020961_g16747.t1
MAADDGGLVIQVEDEFGVWHYIERELSQQLPLRNVVWHSRVFDRLPLRFVLRSAAEEQPPADASTALGASRTPSLYMYLLKCDDPDLFKDKLKPRLRAWLDAQAERQREWIVVYVPVVYRSKTPAQKDLVDKNARKIFDRIKTDFNMPPHRLTKLALDEGDRGAWEELVGRLKDAALSGLEARCGVQEREAARLATTWQQAGWGFGAYFLQREAVALAQEQLRRGEEALKHYDELEAAFNEHAGRLAGAGQRPFPAFGGLAEGDDSGDLLLTAPAPAPPPPPPPAPAPAPPAPEGAPPAPSPRRPRPARRAGGAAGGITEFDFRSYLFARQSALLLGLRKPWEWAERAHAFIRSMRTLLRAHRGELARYFPEVWTYGPPAGVPPPVPPTATNKVQMKQALAPLHLLARHVLSRIHASLQATAAASPGPADGSAHGGSRSGSATGPQPARYNTSLPPCEFRHPSLRASLASPAAYTEAYITLTRAAAEGTRFGAQNLRERCMARFAAELGLALFEERRYTDAIDPLRKAVGQAGQDGWLPLLRVLRPRLAVCERHCGESEALVLSCAWLLSPAARAPAPPPLLPPPPLPGVDPSGGEEARTLHYLAELCRAAREVTTPVTCELQSILSAVVAPLEGSALPLRAAAGEALCLRALLRSALPAPLRVDALAVSFPYPPPAPPRPLPPPRPGSSPAGGLPAGALASASSPALLPTASASAGLQRSSTVGGREEGPLTVPPGESEVLLRGRAARPGLYAADRVTATIGLSHSFNLGAAPAPAPPAPPLLLQIAPRKAGATVSVRAPGCVFRGQRGALEVEVASAGEAVEEGALLRVAAPPGLALHASHASFLLASAPRGTPPALRPAPPPEHDGALRLPAIAPGASLRLLLPAAASRALPAGSTRWGPPSSTAAGASSRRPPRRPRRSPPATPSPPSTPSTPSTTGAPAPVSEPPAPALPPR